MPGVSRVVGLGARLISVYVYLSDLTSYGASLALMGKQTAQYTPKYFREPNQQSFRSSN
jgi:hypothetical protein